jgi:hypothetical protein
MIFGQDRQELRQMYVDAWRKHSAGDALSPLEKQIAQVVRDHPEYQAMLQPEMLEAAFTPEQGRTNPFLHMGLHLAIREQVATDRPTGISNIFNMLCEKFADAHSAEHQALDCLAETLWEAQSQNAMPDENAYLERLRKI